MFPQSELDNYKLQVELLQEKLQRSEISRQQLEHKLDKILQKRDEHDKIVRSKARQKYQQFLEEQQRRNERNKQLIQMLERIEQQTEVMNARSERLKMMKLQYEMYFAKLVHSQTRKCIQRSMNPVTQIMPETSFNQPVPSLVQQQQPFMEGYNNYVTNTETSNSLIPNPYQKRCAYSEIREPLLKSQAENVTWQTTEMPTLDNFVRTERNDCIGYKSENVVVPPLTQTQNVYTNHSNYVEPNINNNNNIYNQQVIPDISYANSNANKSLASVTNLLSSNKPLAECKENSKLSTSFEEIPNSDKIIHKVHNLNELSNTTTAINNTNYNNVTNKNYKKNSNENFQPLNKAQEPLLQFTNQQKDQKSYLQNVKQNTNINNILTQNVSKQIESPIPSPTVINKAIEFKDPDKAMANLPEKSVASLNLKPIISVIQSSPNTSNISKSINNRHPEPTERFKNEFLPNNTETNSGTTSVSIENIENEIYGELLTPLETEQVVQEPDNFNVTQNLLENLVTKPENITNEKYISSEGPIVMQDIFDPDLKGVEDKPASDIISEQNLIASDYEQNVGYDDNYNMDQQQQPEELANNFTDYTNYENTNNTAIGDSQQQQEQYDYSNYDPTQYSYPGYIYDKTTGQYNPDPNAPAEQYATDQQYAAEGGYDQQDYDYNQTYTEELAASSANNNYDTKQQEIAPIFTPSDGSTEQQQTTIAKPEHTAHEPELSPAVDPMTSPKVTKPTSILSTTIDKNDAQKKKKRVNFVDSTETDESAAAGDNKVPETKPTDGKPTASSSESDFDFSSSTDLEGKAT